MFLQQTYADIVFDQDELGGLLKHYYREAARKLGGKPLGWAIAVRAQSWSSANAGRFSIHEPNFVTSTINVAGWFESCFPGKLGMT